MSAIFKTGGKQYRVAEGDIVDIERLEGEEGDTITFDEVMMIGTGEGAKVGSPLVSGATVTGEIIHQYRTRKILVFKKRRRKNSRRLNGHRQMMTKVKITGLNG